MTNSSSRAREAIAGIAAMAGAAAKSSPHSRFIPREELSSFAAWAPGEIAGGSRPSPRPYPPERRADPEATPSPEQLRAARQSGYQDGYRDGLAALEGFKQSFAHQTTLAVGSVVRSITERLDALQQELADAVALAATRLARQVVRAELEARPELVAVVANEAVEALLLAARHVTLRVHPDDLPLVAAGAGEVLAARGARLAADPTVARGGCVVESDLGRIDAGIDSRWRRAAAALGREAAE